MLIPAFLMEQKSPLLLMSPNRASIQRENVLEYPLFFAQSFPHLPSEHRHESKPCVNAFPASFHNMEMTAVAACEAENKWINESQQTVGRGTGVA